MKKLIFNKHYVNKAHTKHYYMGHVFDNFEWKEVISGIRIQNFIISINSPYRKKPTHCERWYNQDSGSTSIAKPCLNEVFYRSSTGSYFCKSCARIVSKINDSIEFTKISPKTD